MAIKSKSANSESLDVVFTGGSVTEAIVYVNTYNVPPHVDVQECGAAVDITMSTPTVTGCNIDMAVAVSVTVKLFIYE